MLHLALCIASQITNVHKRQHNHLKPHAHIPLKHAQQDTPCGCAGQRDTHNLHGISSIHAQACARAHRQVDRLPLTTLLGAEMLIT